MANWVFWIRSEGKNMQVRFRSKMVLKAWDLRNFAVKTSFYERHAMCDLWSNLKTCRLCFWGKKSLLHFVAFFHVASLFLCRGDNRRVGVDNKRALELTNSTVFHRVRQWKGSRAGQQNIFFCISAWFQYRNITQKCNKTSCCIVAWSVITPNILVWT